ncbi:LysE family transporter [Streptomyces sp. SID8379]|uniref:LysE family translocator n=1 Tax=unclassified Streptomyces TaxID=2593676 RepID=UPI000371DA02|nr:MULTISPECIES: LysE family translocator [unclassified Streptomyces]MYW62539.1 LysE family transporter [Streptomyces sp. SID8379]
MLDLTLLPAYLAAVALVTIAPGPDAAYIVAVAVERGPRAGLLSATGMALGMVVHVTAAALGLAVLLQSTPVALTVVELAGGLYLARLAVTTLRSTTTPPAESAPPPEREILRRAVVTNLLNPKTVLFFAAFLPRFTNPQSGPLWLQLLILGLIFLAMGLVWDSTIGLCAGRLGQGLMQGRRAALAVNIAAGTTFAALAVLLLKDAVTTL